MSYNPHQVKSGTPLHAVFSNDPIITALLVQTESMVRAMLKTRLTIKLDAPGKEVLPDKDSPFAYALSSFKSQV